MDKDKIRQRLMTNSEMLRLTSQLILSEDRFLKADVLQELTSQFSFSLEEAAYYYLCGLLGLDLEVMLHRCLAETYLKGNIHRYTSSFISHDAYLQRLHFPQGKQVNWEFTSLSYAANELFFCDDLLPCENFLRCPQMGFFDQAVSFPAVYENGLLWMSVEPSEINTMKQPIQQAKGTVLVCGLGLGYYAYHVHRKQSVKKVVVVEKEKAVIDFFQKHLLPQFECSEKITMICEDAFKWVENTPANQFDTIFVDLWHNAQDGVPLYLKMKHLERLHPKTQFLYWLENSLKSALDWQKFVLNEDIFLK